MLGIYIHNIKDASSRTDIKGSNPFADWYITEDGRHVYLSDIYPTYDWVINDGRSNIGQWIEAAAKKAGR